ncbi:MAG TPA: DUF4252 domain-containing protein [Acidisarcina sp.]
MKLRISTVILLVLCAAGAFAQSAPFPVTLEKELAARASNFTEVTLDKSMLSFASKFLNGKDSDDAKVRELIQKLDGIYVRSYEFDKDNQYTTAEVDSIRKQFAGSEWSPMVRERSKKGDGTDVFVKLVNGDIHGMFVLDAEPKELTFVFISGPIRPDDLNQLGGNFGIPRVGEDHSDDGSGKPKGGAK